SSWHWLLLAGCMLTGLGSPAAAAPEPVRVNGWIMNDLSAAQAEARRTGKPIFTVFRCERGRDCQDFHPHALRGDKPIQKMCEDFVLLRMTYLRGVNLSLFRYDYDLTWMGFFLDADGRVYSRYGSRDAGSADSQNSAEGLLYTMQEVRRLHREES